ncbi:MAG: hypothetical protein LBP71_07010 [Spirochaetaceae bacterium]|nr:hypothetical protein [Spirochaetaceae bacterium]
MMIRRRGFPLILAVLALGLGSCGASISGRLEKGGAGDFNVSASLAPALTGKIRDFLALSQGNSEGGELLINAPAIAFSMSQAPGVAQAGFRNTGPASLEGPVKITSIGDFLAPSGKAGFISFQENPGGGGRAAITINRETAPDMLALISADVTYNLMLLFAPIATGDNLSKEEYVTQVRLIHGEAVASEISGALIRASVEFPGPLVSVRGGAFSGKKAEFTIPLVDLLVLEQPLSYEVVWKQDP